MEVDRIYTGKHDELDDEWVMSLHQYLPERENWMLALAVQQPLLDLMQFHLVSVMNSV